LDRVWSCLDQCANNLRHGFDALQEAGLVEKSMVHGDIEAAAGERIEKSIETVGFHESNF
jgi:hypothetical protein